VLFRPPAHLMYVSIPRGMVHKFGVFFMLLTMLVSLLPAGAQCGSDLFDEEATSWVQAENGEAQPAHLTSPYSSDDAAPCTVPCDCLCICLGCPAHLILNRPPATPPASVPLRPEDVDTPQMDGWRSRDLCGRIFHPPRSMQV